jgi:RNA polymerase sigma factor (sigma-70 family)
MSDVIQFLRRAVWRDADGLTDGQLLDSFFRHHDEAALAVVIRRHGPMVWSVCRHLLRNYQDTEDAFQATFCVLVQKGASIRAKELVGNWLYGVAHQIAVRMRATAARRSIRERHVMELPEPAVAEQASWNDLQPLLYQELSKLPDKYRVLIILCDLERKRRKEVARQLAVPEGTVAGRLARARTMLAKRVNRHGLLFSGGMLGTVLAAQTASASLPPLVLSSTVQAALALATGPSAAGAISANVVALTAEVTKAMCMTKLKVVTAALLALVLAGMGVMAVAQASGVSQDSSNHTRTKPSVRNNLGAALADKDDPKVKPGTGFPIFWEHLNTIARQMNVIKDRLNMGSGGKQTQKLQKEVLDHIDLLIKGLERIENKNQLVKDILAEMKIIRGMQKRINNRTEVQGDQYEGEQVPLPETARDAKEREQFETIRQELKDLAARQEKMAKVTKDLASRN